MTGDGQMKRFTANFVASLANALVGRQRASGTNPTTAAIGVLELFGTIDPTLRTEQQNTW